MTVCFHAPLPPARTGVADYAGHLLDAMRKLGPVVLPPADSDVDLYHLGNNHLHAAIYDRAVAKPGVVVLHDAVLQHFYLGRLSREQYVEEFVFNYGPWSRSLAESLWEGRARSATDPRYFEYGMLRRVAETAKAVIVHNPAAAARVRHHAAEARVFEIPHLFQSVSCPPAADVFKFRARLGVKPLEPLCGVFGYLRETKRVATVVRVCERFGAPLLLAGVADRDLARSLEGVQGGHLHRLAFLEEKDWWTAAHAVDICINLRYPSAGETSGIAIRMLGIGKPVLVSDGVESDGLPPACPRILSGPAEETHLSAVLGWLLNSAADREAIGRSAARQTHERHNPLAVAEQYWAVLRAVSDSQRA